METKELLADIDRMVAGLKDMEVDICAKLDKQDKDLKEIIKYVEDMGVCCE